MGRVSIERRAWSCASPPLRKQTSAGVGAIDVAAAALPLEMSDSGGSLWRERFQEVSAGESRLGEPL
jgi:hypothetical protein